MKAISDMTRDELEKYLAKLKEDLEEVEEERMFVLRQTGYHVSGGTVKKYEAEVTGLKAKIAEVEKLLGVTEGGQ